MQSFRAFKNPALQPHRKTMMRLTSALATMFLAAAPILVSGASAADVSTTKVAIVAGGALST